MNALRFATAVLGTIALGLALPPNRSLAQANFIERFDDNGDALAGQWGPENLRAKGWIFRNQSSPSGSRGFFDGFQGFGWPTPQAGSGYLAADDTSTDFFGGTISAWAILPPIPGQRGGDAIVFHLNRAGALDSRVEVRYAPSGGTSTGSGANGTGDFTQLLLNVGPVPSGGWTRFETVAPGAGRIAIRFRASVVPWSGGCYTGFDTLSVGPPPPSDCNLPPIPRAGEIVTWSAAGGPYEVCSDLLVPATGTVIVEAGTRVIFDGTHGLAVSGTLVAQGTPQERVLFDSPTAYPPMLLVNGGVLDLTYADVRGQLRPGDECAITLRGCTFEGNGMIWNDLLYGRPGFVTLEACAFTGTLLVISDCYVVLRDNVLTDTYALLLRGYAEVSAPNRVIGRPLEILRERHIQPHFVDGVDATGVVDGAGLVLGGGNYLLGGSNVLQGNLYPVSLDSGLLSGSVVPATGNTRNRILTGPPGGVRRLANVGVPYRYAGFGDTGPLTIDPGVRIEFEPQSGMSFVSTSWLDCDGLPTAPIVLKGAVAGEPWEGLRFQSQDQGSRLEYVKVQDARFGVIATDVPALPIENCFFTRNTTGANANTFSTLSVSKSFFKNNGTGVSCTDLGTVALSNPTNPNAFARNQAGVDALEIGVAMDARGVFWGHPSGPLHPQNPGGLGDPIVGPGASGVSVFPFLVARPDFRNTPPVVRMQDPGFQWWRVFSDPGFFFEPGEKVILRWKSNDETGVARQRILVSPEVNYPTAYRVVADDIAGHAESFELTVPEVGFAATNSPQFLKIEAFDAEGQVGSDLTAIQISSGRITGSLQVTSSFAGMTFRPGDALPPITWTGSVGGFPTIEPHVVLESDAILYDQASNGGLPFLSTDAARVAVRVSNNSNDIAWFFADGNFSIRYDERLGLAPPSVQLLTPSGGEAYPGRSVVPITWNASDDEGLYSFDIQASYNGGKTWRLVAEELAPEARRFDWVLPASSGIEDVRVRVIARDIRFQNSSSETATALSIVPG